MTSAPPRGRRLAVFRYLNSAPLLAGLEGPDRLPGAASLDLFHGTPAECAGRLQRGAADAGLIPSIEFARLPDLRLVPEIAISTERRVRSVIVLARRPLGECASVAVDSASRTSVALLRVLLARRHGARPPFAEMAPDPAAMLARHDAALLIADHALGPLPSGFTVHDLADEWHQMTGLPFVFAVWALGAGADPSLPDLLYRSRAQGLRMLEAIAAADGPAAGLDRDDALRYLRENIRYDLGERERAGLQRFLELAADEGLVPTGRKLAPSTADAGAAG